MSLSLLEKKSAKTSKTHKVKIKEGIRSQTPNSKGSSRQMTPTNSAIMTSNFSPKKPTSDAVLMKQQIKEFTFKNSALAWKNQKLEFQLQSYNRRINNK